MQKAWGEIQSLCKKSHDVFLLAADNSSIQQQILQEILSQNADTEYLHSRGINGNSTYNEFCLQLQIIEYEDIQSYIQAIADGEANKLTSEKVILFEMTGGSSGGSKLIPYTQKSLQSFQRALHAWIYDILQTRPNIKNGKAYFAISPVSRNEVTTKSGVSIGASNDSQYLGETLSHKLLEVLILPDNPTNQFEEWKFYTCKALLEAEDLTLISVWSPTFLTELLRYIQQNFAELRLAIANKMPERAQQLKKVSNNNSLDYQSIWPMLDTISCWKDATSAGLAEKLQLLFPSVFIQGKGLLSTEAVTSFPLHKAAWPVLAITSNFYEFLGSDNQVYLADNLELGQAYQVILTNYSGLYRYNIKDQVLVHGYEKGIPMLEFVGRAGICSDLCGEKLTEAFILKAFNQVDPMLLGNAALQPLSKDLRYNLIMDKAYFESCEIEKIAEEIEQALCVNPQYAYARKLGQLNKIKIVVRDNLVSTIIEGELSKGRAFGHIKPKVLI